MGTNYQKEFNYDIQTLIIKPKSRDVWIG